MTYFLFSPYSTLSYSGGAKRWYAGGGVAVTSCAAANRRWWAEPEALAPPLCVVESREAERPRPQHHSEQDTTRKKAMRPPKVPMYQIRDHGSKFGLALPGKEQIT